MGPRLVAEDDARRTRPTVLHEKGEQMIEPPEVAVVFEEAGEHTRARASLTLRGTTFTGSGRARRNPSDPASPVIGEGLAAARALSDLAHKLVEAAAEALSARAGGQAQVRL
jgi:Domain of unknown function (DUF1876)